MRKRGLMISRDEKMEEIQQLEGMWHISHVVESQLQLMEWHGLLMSVGKEAWHSAYVLVGGIL